MALYSIDTLQEITRVPHGADFDRWCSRLTVEQIDAILAKLHSMIDGDRIHTAGWMPGSDWSGTDWEPIYTDACRGNIHESGLCFGLLVWVASACQKIDIYLNPKNKWRFKIAKNFDVR